MLPFQNNLMESGDWDSYKHFKISENWGKPGAMQKSFIHLLEDLREYAGISFRVNYGYRNNSSRHATGGAVDGYFSGQHIIDQFLLLERFRKHDLFLGIGLYPHWNTPGMHLDIVKPGRWLAYNAFTGFTKDNKPVYVQKYDVLNWASIEKYIIKGEKPLCLT